MSRDIQDRIAARANALWQAHGFREGCQAEYRYQASREIELNEQLLAIKASRLAARQAKSGKLERRINPS